MFIVMSSELWMVVSVCLSNLKALNLASQSLDEVLKATAVVDFGVTWRLAVVRDNVEISGHGTCEPSVSTINRTLHVMA